MAETDERSTDEVGETALCLLGFPFEEVLKKGLGKRDSRSPLVLCS
jgi:hypothetical protein